MFEKEEAFDFIRKFLKIENAESRMESERLQLLDDIIFNIQSKLPFQNICLLSVIPSERRKPTQDEMKANFTSGIGGLCFDLNISTFHLLSAIGFEMVMAHCTVSTSIVFRNNHVSLIAKNVKLDGDRFLVDVACGHPTLRAVNLDFEKESPIFFDSYIEYKFLKLDGKLLRMQRKGDSFVARGVRENSEIEFWMDGWRRFYAIDLDMETNDPSKFDEYHREVYTNPAASPFHVSHRVVMFPEGKATMIHNNRTLMEVNGELVITELEGGDEAIKSKIKDICPNLPQELLPMSLLHWRQSSP